MNQQKELWPQAPASRGVSDPVFRQGYMAAVDDPRFITREEPPDDQINSPYPKGSEDHAVFCRGFRIAIH